MTDTIQTYDLLVNATRAILWQYNEAVRLQQIVETEQEWYNVNQTQFWEDWYDNVFNLITANDFGCQVWSIILDIPLIVVKEEPPSPIPPWGFENHYNYDNSNFAPAADGVQTLTLEQARTVLRMRYFQITSKGAVPETNFFLKTLFGELGDCYVVDNGDMSIEYVFDFVMPAKLRYIFQNYDILPRPAGVAVTYSYL